MMKAFAGVNKTHCRAHGSFLIPLEEAAANFLGSKPVIEGRGAMAMLRGWSEQLNHSE